MFISCDKLEVYSLTHKQEDVIINKLANDGELIEFTEQQMNLHISKKFERAEKHKIVLDTVLKKCFNAYMQ